MLTIRTFSCTMSGMNLLTPDEASRMLKITTRQLLELARQHKIPAVKVGKYWRFPEDALNKWVESKLGKEDSSDINLEVARIIQGGGYRGKKKRV